MAWSTPTPQDTWSDKDKTAALRELFTRVRHSSFTWNPPSVAAGSTVDTTLTTSTDQRLGVLRAGMQVSVTPPSTGMTAGLVLAGAWVPADGQLTIRLYNTSGSPIDEGSGSWSFAGVIV